jgi:hypothetical protein
MTTISTGMGPEADGTDASLSKAHQLFGLGSARVDLFYGRQVKGNDEPDGLAIGPANWYANFPSGTVRWRLAPERFEAMAQRYWWALRGDRGDSLSD